MKTATAIHVLLDSNGTAFWKSEWVEANRQPKADTKDPSIMSRALVMAYRTAMLLVPIK